MSRYAQHFGAPNGSNSRANTKQKTLSPIKYYVPNSQSMNGHNQRNDEGYEESQSQSPNASEWRQGQQQSKVITNWVGHNQKNNPIPNRQRVMKLSQSPKGFSSSSIDSLGRSSKCDLSVGRLNALMLQTSSDNCYVSKYSSKKASAVNNNAISSKRPSYSSKQSQQSDQSKVLTEQFRVSNDQRRNTSRNDGNNHQQVHQQQQQQSPKKTLEQQYRDKSPTKNWKDIEDEIKILKKVLKQDIAELNTSTISYGSAKENRSVNNLKGMLQSPPSKGSNQNSNKSPAFVAQELFEENSRLKRMLEQYKIDWKTSLEETLEKEREEMRIVIDQYKEFIDKLLADKRQLNSTLNQLKTQIAGKQSEIEQITEANQELVQQLNEVKLQYNQLTENYEGLQEQYEQQNQLYKQSVQQQQQKQLQSEDADFVNKQDNQQTREDGRDFNSQDQYFDQQQQANGEVYMDNNTQQEYQQKPQGQGKEQRQQQQQIFSKLEEVYRSQVDRIEEESQEYHSQQLSIGEETMKSSQDISQTLSAQSNHEYIEHDPAERDILDNQSTTATTDGLLVHLNSVINRISQEKIKIRDALKQNLTVNNTDTANTQDNCISQIQLCQDTKYQQLQQISQEQIGKRQEQKQQSQPVLIMPEYQESQLDMRGEQKTQQDELIDQKQQNYEQINQVNKISPQHKPRVRSLNPFSQSPKQQQQQQNDQPLVTAKPAERIQQQQQQSNGQQQMTILDSTQAIPPRSSVSVDTQQHISQSQGQQQLKQQSTNQQLNIEQNLKEKFNQYYSNQQKKQEIHSQELISREGNETQLRQVQQRQQDNQNKYQEKVQEEEQILNEQNKSKSVPTLSNMKLSSSESVNNQTIITINQTQINSQTNSLSSVQVQQQQQQQQKSISQSPQLQVQSTTEKQISPSQNKLIVNSYPPVPNALKPLQTLPLPLQKIPPFPQSQQLDKIKEKVKSQDYDDANVQSKQQNKQDEQQFEQKNQLQQQQQQQQQKQQPLEIQSKISSSQMNDIIKPANINNSNTTFTSEADIQKQYETIMLKIKEAQANQYKSKNNTIIPDMFKGIEIEDLTDNTSEDTNIIGKTGTTQQPQIYQQQQQQQQQSLRIDQPTQHNEDSIITSHQFSFREHSQQQ